MNKGKGKREERGWIVGELKRGKEGGKRKDRLRAGKREEKRRYFES